mgnify:CR=1 FL=1
MLNFGFIWTSDESGERTARTLLGLGDKCGSISGNFHANHHHISVAGRRQTSLRKTLISPSHNLTATYNPPQTLSGSTFPGGMSANRDRLLRYGCPAAGHLPTSSEPRASWGANNCHCSPKKSASAIAPARCELGGVFKSNTAQSGSFGTCRALFK